jgi:hypothetical protein
VTARPLFAYGTLCDSDVLAAVLGRYLPDPSRQACQAPGYRAVHYPGRVYPALIDAPGEAAPGLLLSGLTPLDLDILDAFEGAEYSRGPIVVTLAGQNIDADAYLPAIAIAADAPPWTLAEWTQKHKAAIVDIEVATARALRESLRSRGASD